MSEAAEQLHIYLNDHLAGSVAAIELLDDLIENHPAHRLAKTFAELRDEIATDQETLRTLIEKIGAQESSVRKAGAWLAEKVGRAKLRFSGEESIGLLQALETLVLGITGKQLLWRSLAAVSANIVELQGADFAELELRAKEQIDRLEFERLQLCHEVLSDREHS
jgi:molybdopterin converting factor small subunit